jgi:hypothetical protein
VSNRRRSYVTEWRFIMHGMAVSNRAAGVLKPGVMRMYKGMHIDIICVVNKPSHINVLMLLNCA